MIDFKAAVKAALAFLAEAFPNEEVRGVRLEEIDLSPDEKFWYVTVSYLREASSPSELARAVSGFDVREYKVIAIRADDGRVQSMKIRQLV